MENNTPLSESQISQLTTFLADAQRPEKSMSYGELCGFLFGVVCAPELIDPAEWLPMVFNFEPAGYEGDQKQEIEGLIYQLHGELAQQAADELQVLPASCAFVAPAMDNLKADAPFSQWCAGFMSAHDWLEDLWQEYAQEEMQDELNSMVVVLSFFASEDLAKTYFSELKENDFSFEESAEQVLSLHANAMAAYAQLGGAIRQAVASINTQTVVGSKPPRNEPCPCGSGKKFKKCCGC